jgi:dolichol-phosphate mannosyltransferase
MALRDQVTIVVATLNEEDAIGPLIDEIKAAGYNNILVVDGYSKDKTGQIANARGAMVVGQHGKGKAGAVLVARDAVKTPYFLLMDGDYSYNPADIDRFVIHADSYDLVMGFRPKGSPNMTRTHRLGNWILTKEFNLLLSNTLPDVACGMYLMRTESIRRLTLEKPGFVVDQEILAQTLQSGGRATAVPIEYRQRKGMAKAPTWSQGFNAMFTIADLARRYNSITLFAAIAALCLLPASGLFILALYDYVFLGTYHEGYFLGSLILFVLGGQGLTVATIATMLRRMERRLRNQTQQA